MRRRSRRTVRIRRYLKRTIYAMSVEDFLAHFEPFSMSAEEFRSKAKPVYPDNPDRPTAHTEEQG